MAVTAAQLKAVVTADITNAQSGFRQVGQDAENLRGQVDGSMKSMSNSASSFFADLLKFEAVKGVIRGVGEVISGVVGEISAVGKEAYAAVRDYETLTLSMNQLTATQLVQAGVTKDMAQALELAKAPTQELLQWTEQLAIKSPFNSGEVASALRMAEAYGFTQAEAKRLTSALIDFTSGAGLTGDYMQRITMSLGQMAAAGKIDGGNLRELAMAGLPVKQILADAFGVTTAKMDEMVTKGALPAGKALQSIVEYLEKNFKGAAERATNTWQGLESSLSDIKAQDLRALFSGLFDAFKDPWADVVNFLSSTDLKSRLTDIGGWIGESMKAGVATGKQALSGLMDAGFLGNIGGLVDSIKSGDFSNTIASVVKGIEFGAMQIAVEAKAIGSTMWEVGKFVAEVLKAFLSQLGGMLAAFDTVMNAKVDVISLKINPLHSDKDLQQALNREALAQSGMNATLDIFSGTVADSYGRLNTALEGVNAQRDKEIGKIEDARTAYDQLTQAAQKQRKAQEEAVLEGMNDKINTRTLKEAAKATKETTQETQQAAVNAALNGTKAFGQMATAAEDSSKKAGQKMVDQLTQAAEKAVNQIQSQLKKGIDVSINLGKIPGLDMMDAGGNGPFEKLYQLQDVALNLGTSHEGKDTRKFYEQYFGGINFDDAKAQALATVKKFQQGLFDDDVLQFVDVGKMRQKLQFDADAENSQTRLAKLIGADAKTLKAMMGTDKAGLQTAIDDQTADAMAKSLKDGVVGSLGKIGKDKPTIMDALMQGLTSGGAGTDTAGQQVPDLGGNLIPTFLASIDKQLAANGEALTKKGEAAWDKIEEGFIGKAKNSTAFAQAIDSMVDNSLANYIPKNK